MIEETSALTEIMLQAELFCSKLEALAKKCLPLSEMHALSLKISQCRGVLSHLQELYEEEELTLENPAIRAEFHQLLMYLLWVNFLGRNCIDLDLFRKLIQMESSFTHLLIIRSEEKNERGLQARLVRNELQIICVENLSSATSWELLDQTGYPPSIR